MNTWQADFYYFPSQPGAKKLWELTVCVHLNTTEEKRSNPVYTVQCYSEQANASVVNRTNKTHC